MKIDRIEDKLIGFFVTAVLEGDAKDFSTATPLLEYRIIDSLSILELVSFVEREFSVEMGPQQLVPDKLMTVAAIASEILRLIELQSRPES